MNSEKNSDNEEIPGMNISNNYTGKPEIPKTNKLQKETDKTKKDLDKLKNFIVKKFPFTETIGILPPQSIKLFVEDELGNVPEAELKNLEKKIHLYVIIPEEKFKESQKIKAEIVKEIDSKRQNIWLQVKTPVDIWGNCLDSKFELTSAISMAFPLYDKGILGALRVAEIHKSLVLRKFEKYVVSYVIGGSLVRGEAVKTSDVDVFIIINDTDVRRMPRLELKERLRTMIHQYVAEASALAGVKNKLSPQIYLLTDFWEGVKDAHPVMFTFVRDGIPIYDRGTFMPWKALLKMGKLKPSPEAIDLFMSMGDKTVKRAKMALLDILIQDLYWGVMTPSQALLMLYGLPPPTPKQTVKEVEKAFVIKEKILEKKYLNILEKIVGLYKDYEHEKLKEIKGAEIDSLVKDTEAYLKRLKELRGQIEKRFQERTIEQVYTDIFNLLSKILGKKAQAKMVEDFEKELIKSGKLSEQSLRILNSVIKAKADFKKGKLNPHSVNEARKDAMILIGDLIEYSQRKDLAAVEKTRIRLKYEERGAEKFADLIVGDKETFLIVGNSIEKITDKTEASNAQELSKAVEKQKAKKNVEVDPNVFDFVKKKLGKFEIVF